MSSSNWFSWQYSSSVPDLITPQKNSLETELRRWAILRSIAFYCTHFLSAFLSSSAYFVIKRSRRSLHARPEFDRSRWAISSQSTADFGLLPAASVANMRLFDVDGHLKRCHSLLMLEEIQDLTVMRFIHLSIPLQIKNYFTFWKHVFRAAMLFFV